MSVPSHRFGESEPFSVGLEEELMLVHRDTLALAHVADAVLEGVDLERERVDHEAFLAELEVRSEPCTSVRDAVEQLLEGRLAAAEAGATLMAAGLHPNATLFDVEIVESERYERVEAQMQGLIKRTPECALHVHVGVPDPDAAVAAMNGLRELLPLLHGLGANSPFWFGSDSGMASSRSAVIRAYPGRGIPPVLGSWDEYLETLHAVRAGGGPTDHTMVWWDARPQPRLGTVELREVDVQTSLDSAGAIAALARAVIRRAVEAPPAEPAPDQALHWSSFRAARDGLDAEIYRARQGCPAESGGWTGAVRAGQGRPGARGGGANSARRQRSGHAARHVRARRHVRFAPLPRRGHKVAPASLMGA